MADLLTSIEFTVEKRGTRELEVAPPSFRVDIGRPEDLMEEIARLSGYNDIPMIVPTVSVGTRLPSIGLERKDKIRQMMSGFGFSETVNYSFMDKSACNRLRLASEDPRRCAVEIMNPLAEDQTVMRTSMLPGMLQTMHRNIVQQIRTLRLFEIGKVYLGKGKQDLPEEIEMLIGLWTGARTPASWQLNPVGCDYFDIKGVVESLFSGLKITGCRFTRTTHPYTRPGYTAEIRIGEDSVGLIGEVHPEVLSGYDLKQAAHIFELNLNRLFPRIPDSCHVKPLSKFPATTRDITLIVDRKIESEAILESVQKLNEELVESIHLLSVFDGSPIPAGRKSVSFRIIYRSNRETLQDETINPLNTAITDRLVEAFHAALPI
jgi:phenylalanyl-tRNA synthetase beta chain